jgi:hypothetical protein
MKINGIHCNDVNLSRNNKSINSYVKFNKTYKKLLQAVITSCVTVIKIMLFLDTMNIIYSIKS